MVFKKLVKDLGFKDSKLFQSMITSGFNNRDSRLENLKKEITKLKSEINKISKQVDTLVEYMANSGLNTQAVQTIANKINELEVDKGKTLGQVHYKEEQMHRPRSNSMPKTLKIFKDYKRES